MIRTGKTADLESRYEKLTGVIRASCHFITEYVGGQPANEQAIRAFVTHHLKITDPKDAEDAVKRILTGEIGDRDLTPEFGERAEQLTYGINMIRRCDVGPWMGTWQIRACAKQAMSRLGIFMQKKGVRGDVSECGQVRAWLPSSSVGNGDEYHAEHCYLIDATEDVRAKTYFRKFHGTVSTAQGSKSIVHDSECVAAGTKFGFSFRFKPTKLTVDDLEDALALMMVIGLGSVKALDQGKFKVDEYEIEIPDKPRQLPALRSADVSKTGDLPRAALRATTSLEEEACHVSR